LLNSPSFKLFFETLPNRQGGQSVHGAGGHDRDVDPPQDALGDQRGAEIHREQRFDIAATDINGAAKFEYRSRQALKKEL